MSYTTPGLTYKFLLFTHVILNIVVLQLRMVAPYSNYRIVLLGVMSSKNWKRQSYSVRKFCISITEAHISAAVTPLYMTSSDDTPPIGNIFPA